MLEVVLATGNGQVAMPDRMLRLAGYFALQADMLVLVSSGLLALRPTSDGAVLRVIQLDALVAVTVTFLVHLIVLRPVMHLSGWDAVADVALHYVVPALMVGGWLLFGPRRRIELRVGLLALIWPAAWYVWTLLYGTANDFYPYPFVDVRIHGYEGVLVRAVAVTGVLLGAGIGAWILDRRLNITAAKSWLLPWQRADDVVRPSS